MPTVVITTAGLALHSRWADWDLGHAVVSEARVPARSLPLYSAVGTVRTCTLRMPCAQECPGHPTFVALSGWVVEGQSQGDDGCYLQDDERHVLQRFPYQLQESFWLLWRYEVLPKNLFPLFQVWSSARQTCGQRAGELGRGQERCMPVTGS